MSDGREQRRDLLATVEAQRETIAKYENRLRDVVRAYKGLAQEKEALEASLKVIQGQPTAPIQLPGAGETSGSETQSANEDTLSTASDASRHEEAVWANQVRTLTASLTTLTREKSRLESAFQEDRRKHLGEKRQLEATLEGLRSELTESKTAARKTVDEAKSQLIVERHGREKASSDHALKLRELQKVVADEKRAQERLEHELHEARTRLKVSEKGGGASQAQSQVQIRQLQSRIQEQSGELERAQERLKATPPEVIRLKSELAEAQLGHRRELERAEGQAQEAEARAFEARQEQERRVTNLEARLQELSETVGTYDRLRQHDQAEIEKLRERIAQLDRENANLSSRASSASPPASSPSVEDEIEGLELDALIEKYHHLKTVMIKANARLNSPMDLETTWMSHETRSTWQKQYLDLKAEFDAYKRQMTSPGSRSSLLPEADQEVIATLESRIADLQERVNLLKRRNCDLEEDRKVQVFRREEVEKSMKRLEEDLELKTTTQEQEFQSKYLKVEKELQKQRERCLTLIEEKEDEVSMLKANMEMAFQSAFASQGETEKAAKAVSKIMRSSPRGPGLLSRKTSRQETAEDITDGLQSSTAGDGMVLHYVQEIAHKDVDIGSLRKQVFELESTMRELQMNSVAKEERYAEEIEHLGDEVARLARMSSKEGANLEYLKNVVLNYMISSEAGSREHMLKAIGTVLAFSTAEVRQVRDHNASWWPAKTAHKKGHR